MKLTDAFARRLARHVRLDAEQESALTAVSARERVFDVGDVVVERGDRPTEAFVVCEGWAARTVSLSGERTQIVNFMLPGDLFDLQVLAGGPADHTVRALTPLSIRSVEREEVLRLLAAGSPLAPALWWAVVQEEAILREQVVRNGRRTARERVAHLLLELHERLRSAGLAEEESFVLPVGQAAIADALGLSYVHVSRVLSHLERNGLIARSRGLVTFTDRPEIESMCGFSGSYLGAHRGPLPAEPF